MDEIGYVFEELVAEVEQTDVIYELTRNGETVAVIVSARWYEQAKAALS